MGDEAMRRFMKGDGDNYWDHPNGRQVEHIRQAAVLRARLPHLLDLRNEATSFKKRNISAAIVAGAKRFFYQIIRTRFLVRTAPQYMWLRLAGRRWRLDDDLDREGADDGCGGGK